MIVRINPNFEPFKGIDEKAVSFYELIKYMLEDEGVHCVIVTLSSDGEPQADIDLQTLYSHFEGD